MPGTIPLSMTQQFDIYGKPLAGGQLYIIAAGTVSTPQDPFADLALVTKLPNPIPLDAAGRIPQFFLADGYVKIRLQDKFGVVQLSSDNVLVIGPSTGGGGGGGATIDPTTVFQTGDLKPRYDVGQHPGVSPGWVRCNGLTIGSASASPSATERGHADCQNLFVHLWNKDLTLAVSGGRGASASADWTANKTIATPDYRSYAISGLDDMGSAPALRLTPSFFGTATVLGNTGGTESQTLDVTQMPAHKHTASIKDPAHKHILSDPGSSIGVELGSGNRQVSGPPTVGNTADQLTGVRIINALLELDTTNATGGGLPHRTLGPRKLCTIYIKL